MVGMADPLVCRKCGGEKSVEGFYLKKGKPDLTWCKQCYHDWYRSRYVPKTRTPGAPQNCTFCGAQYRPAQERVTYYCSRACKDKAKGAAARAERLASKPEGRACLHCGRLMPQSTRIDAKFCSSGCNSDGHQLKRKLRARSAGGTGSDGYVRAAICERDNWTCGICREPVDRTLKHPDPMCASLDHIIPAARGGSGDESNLRLTHLVCNLRRGARDDDEPTLVWLDALPEGCEF